METWGSAGKFDPFEKVYEVGPPYILVIEAMQF
jgi:hypothetical protein